VRWYSLGFASLQPSEFLKPFFVVFVAWLMAASQEENGPARRDPVLAGGRRHVGMLALQPDFGQASLTLFAWGVMYFVAGAPALLLIGLGARGLAGGLFRLSQLRAFRPRIDGFLSPRRRPATQLGYATNAIREGGFFGVGVGEGR
jgi:cell division protein FtsW